MTDKELKEIVSDVQLIWQDITITPNLKRHINERILHLLRGLDYVARQKLIMLMMGLNIEQHDERDKNFKEPLYGLVSIIDDLEQTLADEKFNEKLHGTIANLSREEQRQLLEDIEQKGREKRVNGQ